MIITVFIHANNYKPYNFIKNGMKKLKVVEVLQYNGVNIKVISTNRTTVNIRFITLKHTCSLTAILGFMNY